MIYLGESAKSLSDILLIEILIAIKCYFNPLATAPSMSFWMKNASTEHCKRCLLLLSIVTSFCSQPMGSRDPFPARHLQPIREEEALPQAVLSKTF